MVLIAFKDDSSQRKCSEKLVLIKILSSNGMHFVNNIAIYNEI